MTVNKPPEPNRADSAADGCAGKVGAGAHGPKPCAEKRTGGHDTVAKQIVSAIGSRAQFGGCLANDERFARRLAKLLQATDDEGKRQPTEGVGAQQDHRKERKEKEGR